MSTWSPLPGDRCVDLRIGRGSWSPDRVADEVEVKAVTPTMVITTDGERYNRQRLHPVSEGRHSDRVLVPSWDDRVLCARGRERLREVAQLAENLAALSRKDPADITAALAQIALAASQHRSALAAAMKDATYRKGVTR